MLASQVYIVAAIAVLAVIAVFMYLEHRHRKEKGLSPLAGLAFAFVLAAIIFGGDRRIGYGLMSAGVLLAAFDMFNRPRRK